MERFGEVLRRIEELCRQRERIVLAIDGRCGSGKTTLAGEIECHFDCGTLSSETLDCGNSGSRTFDCGTPGSGNSGFRTLGSGTSDCGAIDRRTSGCRIFHMDDFYLPIALRGPGWEYRVGGNIHYELLIREVLEPLRRGEGGTCHLYDCRRDVWREETFAPGALTVVEGSYVLAGPLDEFLDFRIFMTCPAQVQERRLRSRDGERFEQFREKWIPMEERYFAACRPQDSCDMVIDTGDE